MAESIRNQIAQNIVDVLGDMPNPRLNHVTREPFDPAELAITQFPAVLVGSGDEVRDTVSMGTGGIKQGTITYSLKGYVRGTDLDTKRNDLIQGIENALDSDRYRSINTRVINSHIITVGVVDRQPPLAEIDIAFEVEYFFNRGQA